MKENSPGLNLLWAGIVTIFAAVFGFVSLVLAFGLPKRAWPPNLATNSAVAVQRHGNPSATTVVGDTTPKNFSRSNVLSVLLGQEGPNDPILHLWREPDGRTTIEKLGGVPCRHLSRTNKMFGYLYFAIDPMFKDDDLKMARIEIEFLSRQAGYFRLQYDALEGETHRPYKTVAAETAQTVKLGSNTYSLLSESTNWQTAAFRVTDAAFRNSQNGGADFRLEISTPDIYVGRITVIRESPQLRPP